MPFGSLDQPHSSALCGLGLPFLMNSYPFAPLSLMHTWPFVNVQLRTEPRTVYSLGVPSGSSPGQSTICWQRGDANFPVQAGSLLFAGLAETRSSQCFLGMTCTFGPLQGFALSAEDRVVAIPSEEHCSQGRGPITTAAVSSRPAWAGPWPVSLNDTEVTVDWLQGAIFAGSWRLCYCVHTDFGCASSASYTIPMGILRVLGPAPADSQHFSCSMNVSACSIGPVSGEGLSAADSIMLVLGRECGYGMNSSITGPADDDANLSGLILEAEPSGGSDSRPLFPLPNASLYTQYPGTWLMCYCVGSDRCLDVSAFSAPLGSFVIIGPRPQSYHCTLGLPCQISLIGHGLHISNAIMVVGSQGCGTGVPLRHEGMTWPQRPHGVAGEFYAGLPTSGPVGVVGHLCWAASWSHWEDFAEVGSFEMLGPQQNKSFTCTFGIPCSIPVLGHGLPTSSEIWIIGGEKPITATWEAAALQRSCGVASSQDSAQIYGLQHPLTPQEATVHMATFHLGNAQGGQVGPFFRICWRHSAVANFSVEVGSFALQGPDAARGVCVKGYPCNVTLGGFGLSSQNSLQLLDRNCSNDTLPASEGLLTMQPLRPQGGSSIYELGTVTKGIPGSEFFLCWSGDVNGELTLIGSILLAGPQDDQDLQCVSGRPCEPEILGFSPDFWKEYWLVTGQGQYLPNFSVFLSSKCEPVWGRHGRDLTHTWEKIPGSDRSEVYFVSGSLHACPNYVLHLHPLDCSVVATPWMGSDPTKSWIELPNGTESWLLTPSSSPCPSRMLTAEAGTLRSTDFFRSPLTWKVLPRDASPWPHRSSFMILPDGSQCNASRLQELQLDLMNPAQCCDRAGDQELQLRTSFGSFATGSGRYEICWGRTPGDGLNGGADSPLPASHFPILVGVLTLLAPESLGFIECTLGLDCSITVSGLGLSSLDSLVLHAGSSCSWPELPPFGDAPNCSLSGSDSYVKAEIVGNERLIVSVTCPRSGSHELGFAKLFLKSYSLPTVARLLPSEHFVPMPHGIAGVALDGLGISGAPANKSLWESSACGVVSNGKGAEYALTPGRCGPACCEAVASWANQTSYDHEPLLGFMMDGVPLFAPLGSSSNFSLDLCGGHDEDLGIYHYHAAQAYEVYSGKVLGCLKAAASGGKGFAVPPAPVAWPPLRPQSYVELLPTFEYGSNDVLLLNAREAGRFLPQVVNSSQAVYPITKPAEVLNYSICWGRGVSFEEHQVRLGSLTFTGAFKKDFLCTLAQDCSLQVEGTSLSLQNRLFVSNGTCGQYLDLLGMYSMPVQPLAGSSTLMPFSLGVILNAAVGQRSVKVCWSPSSSDQFDGRIAEIGSLMFLGPLRLDQSFTCSLGRNCTLRVEEYAPGMSSQVSAGASCAAAVMTGSEQSMGQYSLGRIPPDESPGELLLCWQPLTSPISIRIGSLLIRGPLEMRIHPTAIAGLDFSLELLGIALMDSDQIRIVDSSVSCGGPGAANHTIYLVEYDTTPSVSNSSAGGSPAQDENGTQIAGRAGEDSDAGFNSSDSSDAKTEAAWNASSSRIIWRNLTIRVGGYFRVCWCPSSCKTDSDFATDAGSIAVGGPAPVGVRRLSVEAVLVAGVPFLLRLQGIMLSSFDRLHVIPAGRSCADADIRPYAHEPGVQLVQPSVSDDQAEESWENVSLLAAGQYEACWCPGSVQDASCVGTFTYVGNLLVHGASAASTGGLELVAGLESPIQISGSFLTPTDQVKIVENNCAMPGDPSFATVRPPTLADMNGNQYLHSSLVVRRPPQCRICWCSGLGCQESPAAGEKSWVDLGVLNVLGPMEASAETHAVVGVQFTLLARGGLGIPSEASANARFQVNTCENPSTEDVVATPGAGSGNVSLEWRWDNVQILAASDYRLCIELAMCLVKPCPPGVAAGFGLPIDLGVIHIGGPLRYDGAAPIFAGHPFELALTGSGLSDQDKVVAVDPSMPCGASLSKSLSTLAIESNTSNMTNISEVLWQMSPLPAGGSFKICWCSMHRSCERESDFQVDVGTLLVFGPDTHTSGVCVKGSPCEVEVTGVGMTALASPAVFIRANCSEMHHWDEANSLLESAAKLLVQWPSLLHLPVGAYRICWAADPSLNYTADAGSILLAGPGPYPESRCVSGRLCSVLNVNGVGMMSGDRIAARNATCGSFHDDLGDGRRFRVDYSSGQLETVDFWQAVTARYVRLYPTQWFGNISLRAGLFVRVCPTCTSSTLVDLIESSRSFSSARPTSLPWECFSCGMLASATGWVAEVSQLGEWYQMDAGQETKVSGIAIKGRADADEFVTEFLVSYSLDGTTWTRLREKRSADGFPNQGVANGLLSGGQAHFTWPASIVAPGGVYIMCWKRALESSDFDLFVTTLGSLVVDGPVGGQSWDCVVGKECRISGLQGEGLLAGDLLRLLPLCSMTDPAAPFAAADDQGYFDWGLALRDYYPRTYRLCWCRPWNDTELLNSSNLPGVIPGCGPNNILVDAGVLSVRGPSRENQFTCYAGQTCMAIPLLGEQLQDGDSLIIILQNESCGQLASSIPGMPNGGVSAPADTRGTRFFWQDAPLTASGADYRLCWCSPVLSSCNSSTDYDTNAGILRLVGPKRDQLRTCFAGLQCTVQGLQGHFFQDGEVRIQQSCEASGDVGFGQGVTFDGNGDLTWSSNMANGGIYKLCWTWREQSGFGEAGSLMVLGPVAGQRRNASSSLPLTIALLDGAQGSSAQIGDRLRIVNATCSDALPVFGIHNGGISQKLPANATHFDWAASLLQVPGGDYRMCWCAGQELDGTPRACDSASSFQVDVGTLSISGPMSGQSWTCSTSRPCSIYGLKGAGLTQNDRYLVKVADCFSGISLRGLHWASVATSTDASATLANVSWGNQSVSAEGGFYKVCFCTAAAGAEPCSSQNIHRFTTDAGTLTIKGPRPAHAPWALQFGAEGNDSATHVLVDSSEPEKGLGHALVAGTTSQTIVNSMTTRGIAEASGMTYTQTDSDYTTTDCGWMRHDTGAEQWRATCRYLRLGLQPLNFSNFGQRDVWVTKVGYNGSNIWTRQIGTSGDEVLGGFAIDRTDHSIFLAGSTSGNMLLGSHSVQARDFQLSSVVFLVIFH